MHFKKTHSQICLVHVSRDSTNMEEQTGHKLESNLRRTKLAQPTTFSCCVLRKLVLSNKQSKTTPQRENRKLLLAEGQISLYKLVYTLLWTKKCIDNADEVVGV